MDDRVISKPIISADSHIMEPPDTYSARIDLKYKETAPHVIWDEKRGDTYVVEGMKESVPMGLIAAQDRDGVAAEVIYPSVGMILCNHPDADYKKACFDAYNLWIEDYCSPHPERLLGLGQTAMR